MKVKKHKGLKITLSIISFLTIALIIFFNIHIKGTGFQDYPYSIYLLTDGFHSGVMIPNSDSNLFDGIFDKSKTGYSYVYYTFADKSWFLDNKRGVIEVFPTLFANTKSVIERVFIPSTLSINNTLKFLHLNPNIDVWTFPSEKEKLIELLKHIEENEITNDEVYKEYSRSGFYYSFLSCIKDYSLFYNCHHFSIEALSKAGINIKSEWYNFVDQILRLRLIGINR